jgi:hypothetical protein
LNNNSTSLPYERLPFGMKLVISYFFVTSLVEIAWPVIKSHEALSPGLLGALTARALFQVPALLTGVGLAFRKHWAEYLGYTLLVFATLTFVVDFDRGVWAAAHKASASSIAEKVTLLSIPASVLWHGFWAFLLYRNRPFRGPESAARA